MMLGFIMVDFILRLVFFVSLSYISLFCAHFTVDSKATIRTLPCHLVQVDRRAQVTIHRQGY